MTNPPTPSNLEHALATLPSMLSPSEIATALQMNDDTITKWLNDGALRGFKIGRGWRVLKADLIEDLTRHYNVTDPSTPAGRQRADHGTEPRALVAPGL